MVHFLSRKMLVLFVLEKFVVLSSIFRVFRLVREAHNMPLRRHSTEPYTVTFCVIIGFHDSHHHHLSHPAVLSIVKQNLPAIFIPGAAQAWETTQRTDIFYFVHYSWFKSSVESCIIIIIYRSIYNVKW